MKVTLYRTASSDNGTFGMLVADNAVLALTLEDPWQNNAPNVSCIPAGIYQVAHYDSPAHPDVWEITNVPGRSKILIHSGNSINDTKGCVIVGNSLIEIGSLPGIGNSKATLMRLKIELPTDFMLEIKNLSTN